MDYLPKSDWISLDIKPFLFEGVLVKEKEFKMQLTQVDGSDYVDKKVAIYYSVDTIIPPWVYMLVACITTHISYGSCEDCMIREWEEEIETTDFDNLKDKK